MTDHAGAPETRWNSSEFVDSWLADRTKQATYRPAQEKLVSLLPFQQESDNNVLDTGNGDGSLSLIFLGAYPKAQVVCLDSSEVMLTRALQRLAQFSKRVKFVRSDLREPAWKDGIKQTFDAVISSITIHDVDESGGDTHNHSSRTPGIYSEVFSLLKPEGVFVNYDFFIDNDYVTPSDSILRKVYRKARLAAYHLLSTLYHQLSFEAIE